MQEFLETVVRNSELKAQLKALNDKSGAGIVYVIAIAAEYGFMLSEAGFKPEVQELDADEFMAASGGKSAPRCGCVLAGDAEVGSDGKLILDDGTCACAFFGSKCVDREQPDIRIRVGA